MAQSGGLEPPVTPRLFEYLAVPTGDRGLADAAISCQANLRWASQDSDRATKRDWQAYQNLLQLAGILSTAGVKNARQVWEHVVEFVEANDMAQTELPLAKAQKPCFTTAQEMLKSTQVPLQSPVPAPPSAMHEPCAVAPQASGSMRPSLTQEQLDLINANRDKALAKKHAKSFSESVEAAEPAAALPPMQAHPEFVSRSDK